LTELVFQFTRAIKPSIPIFVLNKTKTSDPVMECNSYAFFSNVGLLLHKEIDRFRLLGLKDMSTFPE
jgi:hypothetical protein